MKTLPEIDLSKGLNSRLTLRDGHTIPILGFGTYGIEPAQAIETAVAEALKIGYRHIDTASIYKNETEIGKALAKADIPREELFITTKVWNDEQGYNGTLRACEASLIRLGLDYVDLYLIHWPKPEHTLETWRAMQELQKAGKVRSLGVSNFKEHHLQTLLDTSVIPVVNQVELHPQFPQTTLKSFSENHQIYLEAWAPLLRGKISEMKIIQDIGQTYRKTPAQIVLRWQIQQDIITIPKTATQARILENSQLFDFSLTTEDFEQIGTLAGERVWQDPDNIDF